MQTTQSATSSPNHIQLASPNADLKPIKLKQVQPFERRWVRESAYGRWFLTTQTWRRYVIQPSLQGFIELLQHNIPQGGRVLDIACGPGAALPFLDQLFAPTQLIAADIDYQVLSTDAKNMAEQCTCPVSLEHESAYNLPYADDSLDVILCHQLLHHSADQAAVLAELKRVLKPDGLLLIGESTKIFIRWWWVRVFFRHPMEVQKTAAEYLQLVRENGFNVPDDCVKTSSPWWSRRDGGFGLWLRNSMKLPKIMKLQKRSASSKHEPTEILLVARKR